MVLFVFQFHPVGNFGIIINFGRSTVRSERVNALLLRVTMGFTLSKE